MPSTREAARTARQKRENGRVQKPRPAGRGGESDERRAERRGTRPGSKGGDRRCPREGGWKVFLGAAPAHSARSDSGRLVPRPLESAGASLRHLSPVARVGRGARVCPAAQHRDARQGMQEQRHADPVIPGNLGCSAGRGSRAGCSGLGAALDSQAVSGLRTAPATGARGCGGARTACAGWARGPAARGWRPATRPPARSRRGPGRRGRRPWRGRPSQWRGSQGRPRSRGTEGRRRAGRRGPWRSGGSGGWGPRLASGRCGSAVGARGCGEVGVREGGPENGTLILQCFGHEKQGAWPGAALVGGPRGGAWRSHRTRASPWREAPRCPLPRRSWKCPRGAAGARRRGRGSRRGRRGSCGAGEGNARWGKVPHWQEARTSSRMSLPALTSSCTPPWWRRGTRRTWWDP